MIYLRFFIIVALVAIAGGGFLVSESGYPQDRIQIRSQPVRYFEPEDTERSIFGSFKFRGGLELSSSDPRFGGISAIRIEPDGAHFLALSDRAYWIRGRIVYKGIRPSSVEDAEIAPVLDPDGSHAARWDTEAIARDGPVLYLGVEGLDRIPVYISDAGSFPVYRDAIPFPPGIQDLPVNQGLEALEYIPDTGSANGILAAFSERGLDQDGNILAYLIQGTDRKTFAVRRSADYDITDAVLLPDRDLLILERKYDIVKGAAMRLRRISGDAVGPGSAVDGPVVLEAGMRQCIDNMEAVGAHRDATGEIVLTLLSDDNYSSGQRTLLLQFTMMDQ